MKKEEKNVNVKAIFENKKGVKMQKFKKMKKKKKEKIQIRNFLQSMMEI